MANRFDPKQIHKLDNPKRKSLLPPEKVLEIIGLKEGETFLDVGAGIGFFTLPASMIVGVNGKVFAVDIQSEMLDELGKRIPANVNNIELIQSDETSLGAFNELSDKAVLCLVLHEIDKQEPFLKEIHDRLKAGGTLTVVEWLKKETEIGPPVEERMTNEEIESMMEKAGFTSFKSITFSDTFQVITGKSHESI
ncbi:MAG: class I SAM-dependent methyltransferase [Fibrobacteres bacterium]|nr:class I SAM-dependent methyltransferase [Fibrobacterota bacterium]